MPDETEIDADLAQIRPAERADDNHVAALRLFESVEKAADFAEPHPMMREKGDVRAGLAPERNDMHFNALRERRLADSDRDRPGRRHNADTGGKRVRCHSLNPWRLMSPIRSSPHSAARSVADLGF